MWLRVHDGAGDDPLLMHISRTQAELDRNLGILAQLMLYCAKGTNGFVPALVVRKHLRSKRILELFTTPPGGATALLHRRGDDCECLDGRIWPATAADFYVHHYLQWNPTKEEYDVAAAKKAELRDQELLTAVRERDHGRCRYCASECGRFDRVGARGLVYDHVDPTVANGAANLVCACRSCNSKKGARTPEAAGMALLPVPGAIPAPRPDTDPAREPTPTNSFASGQTTSRARTGRDGTGTQSNHWRRTAARPPIGDAGPGGHRDQVGPAPPRTDSRFPDPYRRTAITGPLPEHHAGLPDADDYPDAFADPAEEVTPPPGGL